MQWNTWDEHEGELSERERLIADLAFKIGTNTSLVKNESVAQLSELQDQDVFAVIKMTALFHYWQQLLQARDVATAQTVEEADGAQQPPFDASPYFFEGLRPPQAKSQLSTPALHPAQASYQNGTGNNGAGPYRNGSGSHK